MSKSWRNVLMQPHQSIREALFLLNKEALRVVLVVDDTEHLLGVVSDGDVRRGLLRNLPLEAPVSEIMNNSPIIATKEASKKDLLDAMVQKSILAIPLVDDGKVVGLEVFQATSGARQFQNPVFIMAGGFGARLKPLTDHCPKPMLKIGDKPILETMLLSFINAGFVNFYISTHYLPELIREHFGDGGRWNININYVHEDIPLGTGGALGLLPKDILDLPVIMINGDVLTTVDYEQLLAFHYTNNAAATMCVREYEYQIPYGVISGVGNSVVSIEEKPIQRFFVNAGIYVLNKQIIQTVPLNHRIDMPTLLQMHIAQQAKVLMFPIHEYWLDIGRMDDFKKAHEIIGALFHDNVAN